MKKKLTKHGKSLAVVLNKSFLDALNITDTTEVSISLENQAIVIKPINKEKKAAKKEKDYRATARQVMKKYESVLKKLSKT